MTDDASDDASDDPDFSLSEAAVQSFSGVLAKTSSQPIIDPAPPASEFPRHFPRNGERPHYWGHRQRVRDRFAAGGAESMPDYELVEMLLFSAIPKRDVKPLAKQLLADFGGFERLLTVSREELSRHPHVDLWIVHHFKLAEAIAVRLAKSRLVDQPIMAGTEAVIQYLRTRLAHSAIEHSRVLFLDLKNRLIADEEHGRGTINHTPSYPREIVKRALELNALGIVLVHNHPSGDPTPSRQDVVMTNKIAAGLSAVGIRLYDHLIIGASGETSMAAEGLIDQ